MSYTYRVDVDMRIDLNVEADSYAQAEELINQYLAPVSDKGIVDVLSNDGITVNSIESDDDPSEDI